MPLVGVGLAQAGQALASVLTSTTARSANGSCTPTEFSSGGSANATGVTVTAEIRSALMIPIFPEGGHFLASRSIIESRPGLSRVVMTWPVLRTKRSSVTCRRIASARSIRAVNRPGPCSSVSE